MIKMRLCYLFTCLSFFFLLGSPEAGAVVRVVEPEARVEKEAEAETAMSKKELKRQQRKERRAYRQQLKKEMKAAIKELRRQNADDELLLLVIITILLPPLGMYLYEGAITNRFWISLLLTLLFYVPGLVYTLIVILSEN